jgi:ABC-type polysaccharide/polyol phosphate transport system ATPase subunit
MIDLHFNHVSKIYRVRQEVTGGRARHPLARVWQSLRRSKEFWALRDVSFEVERGEALGIIGHNGAGKSTILKLLSNITAPTAGEIKINGRLSALIEVGSGFHPELTGRENVYLSGSILGMRRREITKKLDSIIDFAGVRQFIDTPVKRYSSGMYVRLGFSIAAHLDPDILLLDEVLAVGDSAFQSKCLQRINELKQSGTTIVFISHDLSAIERLCDRVLLMDHGRVAASGAPEEVIAHYQRSVTSAALPPSANTEHLTRKAEVTSVTFLDAEGSETQTSYTGGPLTVRVDYEAHERITGAIIEVFFYTADNQLPCQFTTESKDGRTIDLEPGPGAIEFSCAEFGALPGVYYIDVTIRDDRSEGVDWKHRCAAIRIDPGQQRRGWFHVPHNWRFVPPEDLTVAGENTRVRQPINELVSRL